MKQQKMIVLFLASILAIASATAQVSKDSVNNLQQQKELLRQNSKINGYKIKLASLENELVKKSDAMERTNREAQKAAADNSGAAAKLSSDPQDRKLAGRAENTADDARKKAKRAQSPASDLEDLKKDIESLKIKIADTASKLTQ